MQIENPEKAMGQLEQAFMLAKHSKYTFLEAFLYAKGADLNSDFAYRAEDLVRESNFNPKAICFQPVSVKIH